MSEKPLVYLILGAAGSGRREVVADLIEGGLGAGGRALVLLSDGERAADSDARLGEPGRWHWAGDRIDSPELAGATHVFLFGDGRRNPVDQVEAFQAWLPASGGELGRILCVVHCGLVAQHKELRVWFDACVHFSDVVLLNRRVIAQGPPAYVLTTEHISEAFGAQAHVFQGMVVIDECCPPPGTIEER